MRGPSGRGGFADGAQLWSWATEVLDASEPLDARSTIDSFALLELAIALEARGIRLTDEQVGAVGVLGDLADVLGLAPSTGS